MNIVGGNWKMNGDLASAEALSSALRRRLGSHRGCAIVVFPPSPFLVTASRTLAGSAVEVGAQDIHAASGGAFTSGVSGQMIHSIGCRWTLVGHSERRASFGDDDAMVAQKLRAALDVGLSPVLCIGETLDQRRAGRTLDVLSRQLETALSGRDAAQLAQLVVAYEPVWAIGTGVTATPEQAQEVHAAIRTRIDAHLGTPFARALRIQYGGSVKASNAASLLACPDVDGALVGGASLDPVAFTAIVRAATRRPAYGNAPRGAR